MTTEKNVAPKRYSLMHFQTGGKALAGSQDVRGAKKAARAADPATSKSTAASRGKSKTSKSR